MQNLTIRELLGSNQLTIIGPFGELEVDVVAVTRLRLAGSVFANAGEPPMLYGGVIVGITAQSEASVLVSISPTIDGTRMTSELLLTVNSALNSKKLTRGNYIPFNAGEIIGVDLQSDTTSKDISVFIWVVFDTSND